MTDPSIHAFEAYFRRYYSRGEEEWASYNREASIENATMIYEFSQMEQQDSATEKTPSNYCLPETDLSQAGAGLETEEDPSWMI
ncbi:unnamed protein product [Cylicocyclus nassatus]|uniref:Uncharacterized protein n=1 Tax=Cylicocyclus nassatus TaxID=53992 RepID=A0AA36GXD8_CYLNA|nr:unnamed protein product [Cylicocyclus nassatus]